MKQLVLVSPVIHKHDARISAVVRTNKSNLVIVPGSMAQFFCCDPFCCFKKFWSR